MFMVMNLIKTIDVEFAGMFKKEIALSFDDGMIGCIPVFETKEQAEKFSDGKFEIVQIEVPNV